MYILCFGVSSSNPGTLYRRICKSANLSTLYSNDSAPLLFFAKTGDADIIDSAVVAININFFIYLVFVIFYLFDVKDETFQIFTFGVINVYRVVGRLRHLVQYPDFSAGYGCRAEYGKSELFSRYGLRTREGKYYASAPNLFECLNVKPFVALQRIVQRVAVFCESRRGPYYKGGFFLFGNV